MLRLIRFVFFLCLLSVPPPASSEGLIRIGVRPDCPPLSFVNKKDQIVGFEPDLVRALCAELGLSYEITAHPFAELLPMLQRGELDAVVAGFHATPERERFATFTKPYYHSMFIYIGLPAHNGTVFEGKRIGARTGSIEADYIQRKWGETATPVIADHKALLEDLKEGAIDILLTDGLSGYTFLLSEAGKDFDVIGNAVPLAELEEKARIAVDKRNAALCARLDDALDAIRLNGEYDKISRIYFEYAIY